MNSIWVVETTDSKGVTTAALMECYEMLTLDTMTSKIVAVRLTPDVMARWACDGSEA